MLSFPIWMPASWKLPLCSKLLAPYQADHAVLTLSEYVCCKSQVNDALPSIFFEHGLQPLVHFPTFGNLTIMERAREVDDSNWDSSIRGKNEN